MRIIQLSIHSWAGVSPGAVHYYGELVWKPSRDKQGETVKVALERPMTAKERREYNSEMMAQGFKDLKARPDATTRGFYTEQEIRDFAIKEVKIRWPDGKVLLVEADEWTNVELGNPCLVLWYPDHFSGAALKRVHHFWKIATEEDDQEKASKLEDEWEDLIQQAVEFDPVDSPVKAPEIEPEPEPEKAKPTIQEQVEKKADEQLEAQRRKKKEIHVREGEVLKWPRKIKLEVEFDLWGAPQLDSHIAVFRFADCICTATDPNDESKELGSIGGGMGGYYLLNDSERQLHYSASPDKIWYAFQEAIEKAEQATEQKKDAA